MSSFWYYLGRKIKKVFVKDEDEDTNVKKVNNMQNYQN
jgi:hypothetical protein